MRAALRFWKSRKDHDWTIYKVPDKRDEFDSVELTVDGTGTIIRLQFFKLDPHNRRTPRGG